jgi:chemotaxis protein MotA
MESPRPWRQRTTTSRSVDRRTVPEQIPGLTKRGLSALPLQLVGYAPGTLEIAAEHGGLPTGETVYRHTELWTAAHGQPFRENPPESCALNHLRQGSVLRSPENSSGFGGFSRVFSIIGIVVVIGAIISGYLLEHGNLMVLVQPAELVIIGGAAVGTLLIANPLHTLKAVIAGILGVLKPDKYTKKYYLSTLQMLYGLFSVARKQGDQALEAQIEDPENSASFQTFPAFLKDHHAVYYVCDTLRMSLMGGSPHDLDTMMEIDAETHHHEAGEPVAALQSVSDALPGLGIVAAVLGVVITMGALGGPPEEIGHKVAAALVGTFLGILMCYGFVGPLAARMTKISDGDSKYLMCLRNAVISFTKGSSPADGDRVGPAIHSGTPAAELQRNGVRLQRCARGSGSRVRNCHGIQNRSRAHNHQAQEGSARRSPRRCMEGRLC